MARASYVYVVLDGAGVCAAFTVKHELVTWLGKQANPDLRLLRCPDDPGSGQWYRQPTEMQYADGKVTG